MGKNFQKLVSAGVRLFKVLNFGLLSTKEYVLIELSHKRAGEIPSFLTFGNLLRSYLNLSLFFANFSLSKCKVFENIPLIPVIFIYFFMTKLYILIKLTLTHNASSIN